MTPRPARAALFPALLVTLLCSVPRNGLSAEWRATETAAIPAKSQSVTLVKATAIDIDFQKNLYIVDRARHQLTKFSADGEYVRHIGGFGSSAERFDDPRDVNASSALDIFVADFNNNRVVRFDKNLNFLGELTPIWGEPFDFDRVLSLAVSPQLDLFILEDGSKRIMKFSRFSEPTETFGGINETFGQLLEPQQICLDGSKRLLVSDAGLGAIIVFDYLGNYLTEVSHPDMPQPGGMHLGADGRLYVVDLIDNGLFVFTSDLKFDGQIALPLVGNRLQDVALSFDAKSKSLRLYALTASRCFVYELVRRETAR